MPLESATFISGLVTSNPTSTDGLGQADDHIRLIKQVLVNTFPNLGTAVDLSGGGSFLSVNGGQVAYVDIGDPSYKLTHDLGGLGGTFRSFLRFSGGSFYDTCSAADGYLKRVSGGVAMTHTAGGVTLTGQADTGADNLVTRGAMGSAISTAISGINTSDYIKKSDTAEQAAGGRLFGNGIAGVHGSQLTIDNPDWVGGGVAFFLSNATGELVLGNCYRAPTYAWYGTRFVSDSSGNFTAAGNVAAYSDIRLKTNIRPVVWVAEADLTPIRYDRVDNGAEDQIGFSAQAVRKHYPGLVLEGAGGLLSVNYSGLTAVLWARVQSLETRLAALEAALSSKEAC